MVHHDDGRAEARVESGVESGAEAEAGPKGETAMVAEAPVVDEPVIAEPAMVDEPVAAEAPVAEPVPAEVVPRKVMHPVTVPLAVHRPVPDVVHRHVPDMMAGTPLMATLGVCRCGGNGKRQQRRRCNQEATHSRYSPSRVPIERAS